MARRWRGTGLLPALLLLLGLVAGLLVSRPDQYTKLMPDSAGPAHAGENQVSRVARELSRSVVGIINYSQQGDFFTQKTQQKTGSGVVIAGNGLVVTNNHVVEGARRLVVVLPDGSRRSADLVGRDRRTDLALISVKGSTSLRPARLGDSSKLEVGQPVVAIGNPLGMNFAQSVTSGIVSGLNRLITTEEGFNLELIQTDAAINPGNSGGPLVDLSGQVIGINTVKIALPGFEGMGFSIPSNQVRKVVQDLRKNGKVVRPWLGVRIVGEITPDEARYYRLPVTNGVAIALVQGGPAERAGLKNYDIIRSINGKQLKTGNDLQAEIFSRRKGEVVELEVFRLPESEGQKSRRLQIRVRLEEQ